MNYFVKLNTKEDLIDQLIENKVLKSKSVADAMLAIDRGDFCGNQNAYVDSPQPIGYGATISAPHMHAEALERLQDHLKPGMSALDVGSGSGYLAACMAYMVGNKGKVIGIEHLEYLVNFSIKNISKNHSDMFKSKQLQIIQGDGRKGYIDESPYDCIHVGACALPEVAKNLCEQLKPEGVMVIPVQDEDSGEQIFRKYIKSKDGKEIVYEDLLSVRYVPLTSADKYIKKEQGF